jgi:hypothetical protein
MTKKQISTYQEFISKPEISFWFPILFTAVTITTSFMALTYKVDLLTQRVDQLLENQTTLISKYEGVQVRLGSAERQISVLQTQLNIK